MATGAKKRVVGEMSGGGMPVNGAIDALLSITRYLRVVDLVLLVTWRISLVTNHAVASVSRRTIKETMEMSTASTSVGGVRRAEGYN